MAGLVQNMCYRFQWIAVARSVSEHTPRYTVCCTVQRSLCDVARKSIIARTASVDIYN